MPRAADIVMSPSGLGRAWLRAVRVFLLAGSLLTLVLSRTGVSAPALAGTVGVSLGGLWLLERRKGSRLGEWAAYVLGFVVFAQLRTVGDDAGMPVQVEYPARADEVLFGSLPTTWLQQQLHGVTAIDVYCASIYVSYFVVPHAVGFALWRRGSRAFRRYAFAVLAAVYVGLAVCMLVPTAPPWVAAEGARVDASRILADVLHWEAETTGGAGMNPVAAMPSLHVALAVIVALAAWRSRRARPFGVLYALSMAFALVYTGEHYVVDVVAGALVAGATWAGTGAWVRPQMPSPANPKAHGT